MTTPVIIDAIVVVVLVGFTLWGVRCGLLRSLAGLVIVVVSMVGAGIVAASFAPFVARLAAPLLQEQLVHRLDAEALAGADLTAAVLETMVQPFVHGVLYILSFLALIILLRVLLAAMDLVLKLPGLHFLNAVGGGAVGFVKGALLLFLTVWVLRRLGVSFETELLEQAHILRIFTTNTPLSVLSLLQ